MFSEYKKHKTTVKDLYQRLKELPDTCGIYIIEAPKGMKIEFLSSTTAPETYKGKNLLYDSKTLQEKFNNGDKEILYIGKTTCRQGLRNRLGSYIKYGYGHEVAHRGGRALWQIKNSRDLTVYYYECEDANGLEQKLLKEYKNKYNVLPVANHRI